MKKTRLFQTIASFTFLAATFTSQIAIAQDDTIKDAYRQLRLLNSETEAGINYVSFREQWRKTLGLIDIAIEDSKPSSRTTLLNQIKVTYRDAATLWGCTVEFGKFASVLITCLDNEFQLRNPDIVREIKIRADVTQSITGCPSCGVFHPESGDTVGKAGVMSLFSVASQQIKTLGSILKGKESKKQIQTQNKKSKASG